MLHNAVGFDREKVLLEQLEQLKWEKKIGEYIHANTPRTFMTRDSQAMAQGIRVPAHLYYDASAHVYRSRCTTIDEFVKLAERLLRQVQVQASGQARPATQVPIDAPIHLVKLICHRFHVVAKQLAHRRENRPTLTIGDEYDVQDLLHALLRLHFEDVRPEEWTPSYGAEHPAWIFS